MGTTIPLHLHPFTLLVCGNVLLLALALTLSAVNVHVTEAAQALRIWIGSLLLFVVPGMLFVIETWATMPGGFPPRGACAAGALLAFTVMQQLAVLQITRGGVAWSTVIRVTGLTLVFITCIASLIPTFEARGALIGLGRILIPTFTLWKLAKLMRNSRGARVLLIATLLGQLTMLAVPILIERSRVEPVFLMCVDIVTIFVCTLGMLLWHQEQVEQRLTLTAMTDALTGVMNRHGLMPRLEQELARAARSGRPLSLVIFDLDHFKRVNDQHGHATGDLVLQDFAERACSLIRRHDVFGRWGGEEFLLILPETTLEQAVMAAERLRSAQAGVRAGMPTVTLSAGVVSVPREGWGFCSAAELLASADHLLYVAKEKRDRVVSLNSMGTQAATDAVDTSIDALIETVPPTIR